MLAFCMAKQKKEIISIEDTGLARKNKYSSLTFFALFLALFFTFHSPEPNTVATVTPTLNKQLPLKAPAIECQQTVQLISRAPSPLKLTNGKQGAKHGFFRVSLITHVVIQSDKARSIPHHNAALTLRSQYFYIGAVQPRSPPLHLI